MNVFNIQQRIQIVSHISLQYCNCVRYPNNVISVLYYNNKQDATLNNKINIDKNLETRCVVLYKFMPTFVNNYIIQKHFNLPVITPFSLKNGTKQIKDLFY